ncbi:MAG TPA: DUF2171 domain-containing protein [Bauldia sp.]|nr:DUF2171 domain-containing protein [Bauldia sp.]
MFAASQIKEHMEIVGADGRHVGTVDHLDGGDQIKLAKTDSADGKHHFLAVDLIERVDDKVHLKVSAADARFQLQ